MHKAHYLHVEKGVSIRNSALQCGVGHMALHRVVTGKNEMDAARGRKTAIPKPVEDCLVKMLTQLIDNHHYMDTCNLPIVAKDICVKLGIKTTDWIGGPKWVRNFSPFSSPTLTSPATGRRPKPNSLNAPMRWASLCSRTASMLLEFIPLTPQNPFPKPLTPPPSFSLPPQPLRSPSRLARQPGSSLRPMYSRHALSHSLGTSRGPL